MLLGTGFSEVFLIVRLKLWVWRRKTTEVQPNLHQRKVMVTVWWSAASLIHYGFLSPSETITSEKYAQQIDEMHENYNAYSWHWSTERAQVFSTTTLECTSHNKCFTLQVKQIELRSFASSAIFTWPLANWLPLLQASWQPFAGKTFLQPARGRKCFPRVHLIPKHEFLHYRNQQTYFLLAKMCWLKWFLLWLIKMYLSLVIMI